jgi:hypothetical protein
MLVIFLSLPHEQCSRIVNRLNVISEFLPGCRTERRFEKPQLAAPRGNFKFN